MLYPCSKLVEEFHHQQHIKQCLKIDEMLSNSTLPSINNTKSEISVPVSTDKMDGSVIESEQTKSVQSMQTIETELTDKKIEKDGVTSITDLNKSENITPTEINIVSSSTSISAVIR